MEPVYDLLIIGNGALGNAVAFVLCARAPDLRLALIGPSTRPGSATMAAGAMLNVFGEVEAGGLAHPLQRMKFALAREALKAWPAWLEALAAAAGRPADSGVHPGTTILRPPGSQAHYEAIRASLDDAGEPYSLIDPASIKDYRPGGARAEEAIHIPAEGRIDPRRLLALYSRAFEARKQVALIDGSVERITLGPGERKSAVLADGRILSAAKLLIAAGAESGRLIGTIPALAGRIPPLLYGLGAALHFDTEEAPDHVLRAEHPAFEHGLSLVPQGTGAIYVGASSDLAARPESTPRPGRIEALQRAAAALFDARLASRVPRVRLGFRPVTEDGFPLIGETSVPGLYVLSGTKRDGLHLSPVYARDMAARILSGGGFIRGFEPERKTIGAT